MSPEEQERLRQHPAGKQPSEFELDNMWYEAFAAKVHSFGKKWPDPLTAEEEQACCDHADSIVRRPKSEEYVEIEKGQ